MYTLRVSSTRNKFVSHTLAWAILHPRLGACKSDKNVITLYIIPSHLKFLHEDVYFIFFTNVLVCYRVPDPFAVGGGDLSPFGSVTHNVAL